MLTDNMRFSGCWVGLTIATTLLGKAPVCPESPSYLEASLVRSGVRLGNAILEADSQPEPATSPLLAQALLYALGSGAEGSTRQQITRWVALPAFASTWPCWVQQWSTINDSEGASPNGEEVKVQFTLDGHLWLSPNVTLRPAYLDSISESLQWESSTASFSDDPTKAIQSINEWVADHTDSKVTQLFHPGDVSALTHLVMATVLKLQGLWRSPFNPEKTSPQTFYHKKGSSSVPMMEQTAFLDVLDRPEGTFVWLPLRDPKQEWGLLLGLPKDRNGLISMLKALSPSKWSEWFSKLSSQYAHLMLPRWQQHSNEDLAQIFPKLGLGELFTPDANFQGITAMKPFFVSAARMECELEVTESGLKAVAAAGAAMNTLAILHPPTPREIRFDHPFFWAVVERSSQACLLMGTYGATVVP